MNSTSTGAALILFDSTLNSLQKAQKRRLNTTSWFHNLHSAQTITNYNYTPKLTRDCPPRQSFHYFDAVTSMLRQSHSFEENQVWSQSSEHSGVSHHFNRQYFMSFAHFLVSQGLHQLQRRRDVSLIVMHTP